MLYWQWWFVDFLSFRVDCFRFLFEHAVLFSVTGSNPVETSGNESGCISDTHHMWFIILRLACPGQIGLCIFSDSPIHIHGAGCDDTSGRWKCFQCLCPTSKGLMGTTTGDVTQEAPQVNPLHPHLCPPACITTQPPSWQLWGQLTN